MFIILGVAFWTFLTISAVAGIVADYKKRRLELEPLLAAIERGQQLDPTIVERLMTREQKQSEPQPVYFRIGGIVTVSAGVGLGVLAFLLDRVAPQGFYPILGAAVVAVCVGIGLLICAQVIARHLEGSRAQRGLGV
ncbi:MAG: hypothetical protein ACJ8R9_21360 [Steroidobacteraceae bacterium]